MKGCKKRKADQIDGGESSNQADVPQPVNPAPVRAGPRPRHQQATFISPRAQSAARESENESSATESDPANENYREQDAYLDPVLLEVGENVVPQPAADPYRTDLWNEYFVEDQFITQLRSRNVVSSPLQIRHPTTYHTGPQNLPAHVKTESDYMGLFYSDVLLQTFCDNSNAYNRTSGKHRWDRSPAGDLTIAELKSYFACILYMGIAKLPNRDMYFDKSIFTSDFISQRFSKRRFDAISHNLHWTNTADITQDERTRRNKANGFWTVDSYIELLATSFRLYYSCCQFIDVNEMCIGFKGRHRCKCYNPHKPNKWHLKAFCLNCSDTGYLSNVFMYKGKDEQRPAGMSATLYPVMKLTEPACYHRRQHCMATDNWYTSIELQRALKQPPRCMESVGTCKKNRAGLPADKLFQKSGRNRKVRGDIKCYINTAYGHSTYLTCWMDSKPVHMLSTFAPTKAPVLRNSKDGTGRYVELIIPRPSIIGVYNGGMGGTDAKDQVNSYYKSRHKSLKWQHVIFDHFLLCSATNAYILMRDDRTNGKTGTQQSTIRFMTRLIEQWCGIKDEEIESESSSSASTEESEILKNRTVRDLNSDWATRSSGFHYSTTVFGDNRRSCRVCSKQHSNSYCVVCRAFACTDGYGENNCFWRLHNLKNFRVHSK